jgi:hypothetical protein
MPSAPHRVLRTVLNLLALLTGAGGLLLILIGKPLLIRMFLAPPEAEFSTMLLVMVKETGGFLVLVSALCYLAARDPVRNVAIIDGLIVGFSVLAITPLLSLYTTDVRSLYPAYLIWGRALGRLALAAWLYYLRPRAPAHLPS